jgi:hypothetical protein
MIAAGAAAFMLTQKKINVQIINDLIDKTYGMIRRYLFPISLREKAHSVWMLTP